MIKKNKLIDYTSIIILNYNGLKHLPICLSSLVKQSYHNYEIILVDNASTDKSVEFLRSNFPNIKVIVNNKNDGTAGGFNFGAGYAKGNYILFLANDLEVNVDLLERLIEGIEKSEDIAICTAKMYKFDNRKIIDFAGFKLDIFGFPFIFGHNEIDTGKYDKVRDAAPTGTCLLIKKDIFEKVGGFDDKFFTLADELDLWWRIRLLGYRSVINHKAIVYHKAGATLLREKRARLRFYSEKNTIRMLLKNYSIFTLFWISSLYLILLIGEMFFYLFFLRRLDMFLSIIKAVSWNISNFKSTLILRRKVQTTRRISDREIFKDMLKKSIKISMFRQYLRGEIKDL